MSFGAELRLDPSSSASLSGRAQGTGALSLGEFENVIGPPLQPLTGGNQPLCVVRLFGRSDAISPLSWAAQSVVPDLPGFVWALFVAMVLFPNKTSTLSNWCSSSRDTHLAPSIRFTSSRAYEPAGVHHL